MKLVFLILFFSLSLQAQTPEVAFCPRQISRAEMATMVFQVKDKYFPELAAVDVSIKEFDSDNYFLQAQPQVGSLLNKKEKRKYFVILNPKLYDCSPSQAALEAILVHEFEHIMDYESDSSVQIIGSAIHYVLGKKYRANYERSTDLKAIKKGFAAGLIEYRQWLYLRLSEKALKLKLHYYLNPEEISQAEQGLK